MSVKARGGLLSLGHKGKFYFADKGFVDAETKKKRYDLEGWDRETSGEAHWNGVALLSTSITMILNTSLPPLIFGHQSGPAKLKKGTVRR